MYIINTTLYYSINPSIYTKYTMIAAHEVSATKEINRHRGKATINFSICVWIDVFFRSRLLYQCKNKL